MTGPYFGVLFRVPVRESGTRQRMRDLLKTGRNMKVMLIWGAHSPQVRKNEEILHQESAYTQGPLCTENKTT